MLIPVPRIEDCHCGSTEGPHKKFYLFDEAISNGFYCIVEGKIFLEMIVIDGYVSESEKGHLLDDLSKCGLPERTKEFDEGIVNFLVDHCSYFSRESLENKMASGKRDGFVTPEIEARVLRFIKRMGEEEKIDLGVEDLAQKDLSTPEAIRDALKGVDPRLAHRILLGAINLQKRLGSWKEVLAF